MQTIQHNPPPFSLPYPPNIIHKQRTNVNQMNSIINHSPPPSSSLSKCNCMRQMRAAVFPAKKTVRVQENRTGFSSFRTRATVPPVYITASSSAANGNLSVLLQTSAVLLFAYWIANFVVPGFIMEDYRKDKSEDNQDDPSQD